MVILFDDPPGRVGGWPAWRADHGLRRFDPSAEGGDQFAAEVTGLDLTPPNAVHSNIRHRQCIQATVMICVLNPAQNSR
jgi:hypothetical protein